MTPERLKEIEERLGLGWGWDWYSDAADDLLAEVKRLRQALTERVKACRDQEQEWREARDCLLSENDRLREALEPLVAKAHEYKEIPGYTPPRLVQVSLKDLRRAAAALAPTPPQAGEEAGEGEAAS